MFLRKKIRLQAQIAATPSNELDEIDTLEDKLSEVENNILPAEYSSNAEVELPLTEEEKGEWGQSQKAYGDL